jgi:hypothetical protein
MTQPKSNRFTKSRTLGLWAFILLASYISAAQPWFSLEMSPNGTPVELGRYDGFTAYGFLSPILLVCLAALFSSAFLGGVARKISAAVALVATGVGLVLLVPKIVAADISGLASQIEKLTGIAATHGIKDLTVLVLPWAWISMACLALLLAIEALLLLTERNWPKKSTKSDRYQTGQVAKDENDTIGLWDSQR